MTFKETLGELKKSEEFKKFKKKHPDSYLYAAFFVLGSEIDQKQLDFYIGEDEKVATFNFSKDEHGKEIITEKEGETVVKTKSEKINEDIKIDTEEIKKIAEKEAEKEGMKMEKIIAILQNINGNQLWNLTVIMPSFFMLRLHIDMSGEIIERKKGSLFDIIQKNKDAKYIG